MGLSKIGAVSLGCSKNAVDSEIMLGALRGYGFDVVSDAREAEVIIVNTCGFIESAKEDSLDTILEMARYKTMGKCRLLAVTGCLSERYGMELRAELPEVDMFWGVKDYPLFAAKLAARCGRGGGCEPIYTNDMQRASDAAEKSIRMDENHSIATNDETLANESTEANGGAEVNDSAEANDGTDESGVGSQGNYTDAVTQNRPPVIAGRLLTTPPHRAYLRIADGCDNRCTYCAIPLIRGGRVSVPMDKLIKEAEALAEGGVTELTIIAQDTSAYGIDLYGRPMLRELLMRLARIRGLHWIRLLYAYPNTVTEELVDAMRNEPKICNYIDIPIQHISSRMLEAMNRHGSAEHIKHMVDYIRSTAPDMILRTTVMIGFPGETEEDFGMLMRFLREHPFDRVGAFVFSPEDGTPAAEMDGQIDRTVAEARLDMLMRMQRDISLELNKRRVGTVVEALVERVEGVTAYCRSYAEAADVDGLIKAGLNGATPRAGDYVSIRLTAANHYDLIGEVL